VRVAGVAAPGFRGLYRGEQVNAWVPVGTLPQFSSVDVSDLRFAQLRIYGRLRPGATVAAADAHVQGVLGSAIFVRTLADTTYGREFARRAERDRRVLGFLGVASALVLLLGCINVASLLLARAHMRRRETAIRLSIGCSRAHLLRLYGGEALVLATLGTCVGVILARVALWALQHQALPSSLQIGGLPGMDAAGVAAAAAAGAATAAVCTLMPAAVAFRTRPALLQQDTAPKVATGVSVGTLLLGLHVTLTVMVLVSALLVGRSLRQGLAIDVGFDIDRTMQVGVRPSALAYRGVISEDKFLDRRRADYVRMLASLKQVPGVEAVALGMLPLAAHVDGQALVEAPARRVGVNGRTMAMPVAIKSGGPGLVTALGLALIEGRDFRDDDLRGSVPVAIVNLAAAQTLFANRSALGQLVIPPAATRASQVIGVVQDAAHVSLRSVRPATVYVIEDTPSDESRPDLTAIVRTAGPPQLFKAEIARIVSSSFPEVTWDLVTGREALSAQLRDQAFGASVSIWYGVIALLVALIGVQNSVTVMIASRRRELAVRLALGATAAKITRFVSGRALIPVVAGVAVGLGASVIAARGLAALLFEISPFDWPSYAAVAVGVPALAGLQALIAARHLLELDAAWTLHAAVE
jgi:predicted permease